MIEVVSTMLLGMSTRALWNAWLTMARMGLGCCWRTQVMSCSSVQVRLAALATGFCAPAITQSSSSPRLSNSRSSARAPVGMRPSTTSSWSCCSAWTSTSLVSTWMLMDRRGWLFFRVAMVRVSRPDASAGMAPTVTRPRLPDSSAASSSRMPESSAKTIRA
ncbi:hypothetical protein D9M68_261530 [compost metagenome]